MNPTDLFNNLPLHAQETICAAGATLTAAAPEIDALAKQHISEFANDLRSAAISTIAASIANKTEAATNALALMALPRRARWTYFALLGVKSMVHPWIYNAGYYGFNIMFGSACLYVTTKVVNKLFWASAPIVHKVLDITKSIVSTILRQGAVTSAKYRQKFRTLELPDLPRLKEAHSHPEQQAIRERARRFARDFALVASSTLFYVQPSASESKHPGVSYVHWPSDLPSKTKDTTYHKGQIEYYCDSDYYDVTLPYSLATRPRPRLFYTFAPDAVAKDSTTGGTYYTFDETGKIEVSVPGGAKYSHYLWNFGSDHVKANIGCYTTVYTVERRRISPTHQLIYLEPVSHHSHLGTFANWYYSSVPTFQRFNPVVLATKDGSIYDAYLFTEVSTSNGLHYSLGTPRCYHSVEVSAKDYSTLRTIALANEKPLSLGTIRSHLQQKDEHTAAFLWAFLKAGHSAPFVDKLHTVDYKGMCVFDVASMADPSAKSPGDPGDFTPLDEQKPINIPYMQSLVPTYSPLKSFHCDRAAIQGRLERIKKSSTATRAIMTQFDSFIKMMKIDKRLVPYTIDEVRAKQPRPTQQHILDDAELTGPFERKGVKSFVKAEIYVKVTDPRNITTYPPRTKLEYSQLMYPISDWVKEQNWPFYAFYKTPIEIARSINDRFKHSNRFIEIDAERQDGHINVVARVFELKLLQAFYGPEYADEIARVHAETYDLQGTSKFKYRYEQGMTRGSGSPDTSIFNTLFMIALYYIVFRWLGCTPVQAWQCLMDFLTGGGDDALIGFNDADDDHVAQFLQKMNEVADALGQVLVANVKTDEEPVSFFARYYFPRYGMDSCCDIKRALGRLSSSSDPIAIEYPLVKLTEKLSSLYMTDRNTPFISDIIDTAMDLGLEIEPSKASSWWAVYDENVQFPNEHVPWMDTLADNQGLDRFTLYGSLNACEQAEDLLLLPPLTIPDDLKPRNQPYKIVTPDGIENYVPANDEPLPPVDKGKDRVEEGGGVELVDDTTTVVAPSSKQKKALVLAPVTSAPPSKPMPHPERWITDQKRANKGKNPQPPQQAKKNTAAQKTPQKQTSTQGAKVGPTPPKQSGKTAKKQYRGKRGGKAKGPAKTSN
jgi:hypothetical protein